MMEKVDWSQYTVNLHAFLASRIFLSMSGDPYMNMDVVDPERVDHEAHMYAWDIMRNLREEIGWNQVNDQTTIRPTRSNTPFTEIVVGEMPEPERKSWHPKKGKKAGLWRILGELTGQLSIKHRGMDYYCDYPLEIRTITKKIDPIEINYNISGTFLTPHRILSGYYFYNPVSDELIVKEEIVEQRTGYQQVLDELNRPGTDNDVGQYGTNPYLGLCE